MKPYFAKYLPINGELKESENNTPYFIGNDFYITMKLTSYEIEKLHKQFDLVGTSIKPAKLFLCSKDIQIGDDIIDIYNYKSGKVILPKNDGTVSDEVHKTLLNIEFENYTIGGFLGGKYVKIIGEISSDATWIKEGDELDEDQIKRIITVKDYFGEDDYTELNTVQIKGTDEIGDGKKWGDELVAIRPIKIKGPCGHFH